MALRISPITAPFGRLSIGISRTSIRFNSTKKKRRERIEPSYEPGHGEKIFIFNHFLDGMTVYSHNPVLKANRALKQIPYNGKKLKPAKLRKDYWRPMAMVQFPTGLGEVGRSVYQRLRECKQLHELAWDDDTFRDRDTGKTLTRHERGRRLNDQKANTVADLAAVLAGAGKGNKMWARMTGAGGDLADVAVVANFDASAEGEASRDADGGVKALVKTTVWWANAFDREYAKKWTDNVTHELFEDAQLEPIMTEEAATAELEGGETSRTAPSELVAEQELQKDAGQSPRA